MPWATVESGPADAGGIKRPTNAKAMRGFYQIFLFVYQILSRVLTRLDQLTSLLSVAACHPCYVVSLELVHHCPYRYHHHEACSTSQILTELWRLNTAMDTLVFPTLLSGLPRLRGAITLFK